MIKEEVLNDFRGKNVLITGGTGLIGRQIVNLLCDAGAHVKIASLDKITRACFRIVCRDGLFI